MEHTLTNGKRVDCFLFLGEPHECVPIDSKFAWENYTKFVNEKDEHLKKHILRTLLMTSINILKIFLRNILLTKKQRHLH